jgi:hypothetical protein
MINPFANAEKQEAKSDRKSGDELLPKGGDGDQAACGGHDVRTLLAAARRASNKNWQRFAL